MRRRSLSPPRGGVTHSRYSPPCTTTVSPGWASAAARLIVRSGAPSEPSAESDPVVATWNTDVMACRPFMRRWPRYQSVRAHLLGSDAYAPAQHRAPRRVAGRPRRAAGRGEGAHPPRRRARAQAPGASLGARGEGLQLRDARRDEVPRGAVRRALPAARLPLHVRPGVRRRLPGVLVDRGQPGPERRPSGGARREADARLAGAAGEAAALPGADGLAPRVGLDGRRGVQPRPRLPVHQGGARAVPRGTRAAGGRAERRGVRRRCGDVRRRGTGPERVRPRGRRRVPDLRHECARARAGDGLLLPAGSRAIRAQRGRRGGLLAAPARRVRALGALTARARTSRARRGAFCAAAGSSRLAPWTIARSRGASSPARSGSSSGPTRSSPTGRRWTGSPRTCRCDRATSCSTWLAAPATWAATSRPWRPSGSWST